MDGAVCSVCAAEGWNGVGEHDPGRPLSNTPAPAASFCTNSWNYIISETYKRERSGLLANSVCFVSKCVLWCFAMFCGVLRVFCGRFVVFCEFF